MQNPMLSQIGQSRMAAQIDQIKRMYNTFKNVGNPQVLIENAMCQNTELKNAIEKSDGNYEKAFYKLAEEKGVNPNDILSVIKQLNHMRAW